MVRGASVRVPLLNRLQSTPDKVIAHNLGALEYVARRSSRVFYSSSLKHLLRLKQRWLKHALSFLRVIVCSLDRNTHEKSFPKALSMIQGVKNEL